VPHPNVVLFDVRVGFHIHVSCGPVAHAPNPRPSGKKRFYDFNLRASNKTSCALIRRLAAVLYGNGLPAPANNQKNYSVMYNHSHVCTHHSTA
jgi:hypothetical protein